MVSRTGLALIVACTSLAPGGCAQPKGHDQDPTSTSSTGGGSASTGLPPGCGDGAILAPEACDDGNVLDGDGCNSDCQISGSLAWCKAEVGDGGPGGDNIGLAVATDHEGNAIVVGHVYDGELDDNVAIVLKYSGDGSLLWKQTLAGELHAGGVVARSDDSIVVSTDRRLFALTAKGEITYSNPMFETFGFQWNGLDISAEGTIAFAANTNDVGVVGALNSDLTPAWSHEVNDLGARTALGPSPLTSREIGCSEARSSWRRSTWGTQASGRSTRDSCASTTPMAACSGRRPCCRPTRATGTISLQFARMRQMMP